MNIYGGTKDGLALDDIRSLVVLMPSEEEQVQIVRILDSVSDRIDALIAEVRKAIELLNEYRTALISAAVTGKIDVREEGA